jgi:hypothetical protein
MPRSISMSAASPNPLDESRLGAVRTELTRVLESPAFRTSRRCREFLDYIVQQTLNGPGDNLKERSIGVELFQLPPDFDTGQHTIVRVTANEVRKRLAQYYLAENGAHHAVRIELPPGSYAAEFKWALPAAGPPAPPASTTRAPLLVACAAALAVIAGAIALWRWQAAKPGPSGSRPSASTAAAPSALPGTEDLRLGVGSTSPYVDRSGRTWGLDRFFSGGTVVVRPAERILRTLDPDIYRHLRQGEFRYDIPLAPGSYQMHLHFAETGLSDSISAESSGEGQRLFHVSANGKTILEAFDVVADAAGANTADERVFRNISPAADGSLHLSFVPMRGTAILSAIELLPVAPGKVRPLRIRAGWPAAWQDPAGNQWQSDSRFLGGNALVRNTNPARDSNSIPPGMAVYTSERWGHFSYSLPVAEGRYRVTLRFCEGHYGRRNTGVGGAGSRVFDVYANGVALLKDFDIFQQAGGEGRPLDRTFTGIRPTAQGKIVLTFVPVRSMACVNGIEVEDESK